MEFFEPSDKLLDEIRIKDSSASWAEPRYPRYMINRKSEFIIWMENNIELENFWVRWIDGFPIFFFKNPEDALKCILRWAE